MEPSIGGGHGEREVDRRTDCALQLFVHESAIEPVRAVGADSRGIELLRQRARVVHHDRVIERHPLALCEAQNLRSALRDPRGGDPMHQFRGPPSDLRTLYPRALSAKQGAEQKGVLENREAAGW